MLLSRSNVLLSCAGLPQHWKIVIVSCAQQYRLAEIAKVSGVGVQPNARRKRVLVYVRVALGGIGRAVCYSTRNRPVARRTWRHVVRCLTNARVSVLLSPEAQVTCAKDRDWPQPPSATCVVEQICPLFETSPLHLHCTSSFGTFDSFVHH